MPAKSKAQQKAAGAALSAKRGETKPSELIGASRQMYQSMSEKQLDDFASTKRRGKPEYVKGSYVAEKKAQRSKAAKKGAATRAANKAKKRSATTRGKNSNAKTKSKKASRPKKSPSKAARRR
jgi:hypothetical protein